MINLIFEYMRYFAKTKILKHLNEINLLLPLNAGATKSFYHFKHL